MATFAALANKVRLPVAPIDRVQLFREAENDFIEKTFCVETYANSSTGTSTNLIDLPSGHLKTHRITWDGVRLEPLPQGARYLIHDTDGNPYTGTPKHYWIENEDIHLIPQPGASGYLGHWYTAYNTDESSDSPTIPTIEHEKLIPFVMARILEMDEKERRALYYWNQYNNYVTKAKIKYYRQRYAQGGLLYEYPVEDYTNVERYGVETVANEAEYIWKKVEVAGHDEYPPTEQTFVTGTSPLTAALLDSPQDKLPIFRDTNTHVIEITTAYQDRLCYLSTEPTVSDRKITFGLTLSEAGTGEACYFDLKLIISS